ncbi:MAG: hypothetical protein OXC61_04765 [Flavobacteriaceae bacterium]|nr:hypothetical protein [Flavobacteriaceae bacterium]
MVTKVYNSHFLPSIEVTIPTVEDAVSLADHLEALEEIKKHRQGIKRLPLFPKINPSNQKTENLISNEGGIF